MISENEARQTVLALGTAMYEDDKDAREAVYAGMSEDDLKRVIRWAMRQLLTQFAFLSQMNGADHKEAWSEMALGFSLSIANDDEGEEG
jgi:hypothetical protein